MAASVQIGDWSTLLEGAYPTASTTIREWRRLLVLGPAHCFRAGTHLLEQSSAARTIYLIESGIVKLRHINEDGHETVLLLRFSGDLVGAYGTLLQLPHFVSATTVTDCRLVETPSSSALHAFAANAEAAYFLAQCQTIDAVRIQSLLMEARLLSSEQRFFRLLLQVATATGSTHSSTRSISVQIPLSESEIANLIAMNHSAFSRLKRALIRNGNLLQERNIFSFSRHLAEAGIST